MILPLLYQQDLEQSLNAYANKNMAAYLYMIYVFLSHRARLFVDRIVNRKFRFHIHSEFCQLSCLYMLVSYFGYKESPLAFAREGLAHWDVWRGSRGKKRSIRAGTNWGKCSEYGIHCLHNNYVGCITNFGETLGDMTYIRYLLDKQIPVMMRISKKNFDFDNPIYHAAHWIMIVGYTNDSIIVFDPNKDAKYPASIGIKIQHNLVYVPQSFLFSGLHEYVYQTFLTKKQYASLPDSPIGKYLASAKIEQFDSATFFIGPKI